MSGGSEWEAVKRNERLVLDELNVKALAAMPEGGAPEGWACAEEEDVSVALDTELSDELVLEGIARDLVRRIQNLRKESGFEVDDRIVVRYRAAGKPAAAVVAYADYIKRETLADDLTAGDAEFAVVKVGGEEVEISVQRAH